MAAPLFNFILRDWNKVQPWGFSDGTKHLSWFGFSDGWYWLNCGKEELFRYTPEVMAHWGMASDQVYCGYQVCRLWEDVLDLVPAVLEPVPEDLASILSSQAELSRWSSQRTLWFENTDNPGEIENAALDWVGQRFLDSGYLVQGPQIIFWRTKDLIHIRWHNSDRLIDGVTVWTAQDGSCEIPVREFVQEVESFHKRFTEAMKKRVHAVAANWNRPDVQIDTERLIEEQAERENALSEALARQQDTEWDCVREGRRMLNEFKLPSGLEAGLTK
jgi:hypothetical protein